MTTFSFETVFLAGEARRLGNKVIILTVYYKCLEKDKRLKVSD